MTATYTIPGAAGSAPVSITVNDNLAGIDPALIAAITGELAAGMLVAQEAPPDPFLPAPPLGGYAILRDGGTVDAVGQRAIVAGDGAPATITGGGAAAQTVLSGSGGLTFTAASGNATIAAGGTGNTINLLGGNNTLYADNGVATIAGFSGTVAGGADDTITAAAGNNTIFGSGNLLALGSGSTLVQTLGDDTVVAGSGSETIGSGLPAIRMASTNGEVVFGGASRLTFIGPANDSKYGPYATGNTVLGGAGSDTIVGTGLYVGGTAGNNVIEGSGVLEGGGNGDYLLAGGYTKSGTTLLLAGSGNETLSALGELVGNVVYYAGNNVTTAGGTVIVANDLMGAGVLSTSQTFFAGTGNAVMFAGGPVIPPAGSGDPIVSRSDLFVFVNGRAGGTDAIVGFNAASHVTLQGYAADAVQSALASATIAGGSTAITLVDHTTILFEGVTNLTSAAFV